MNDVNQDESAQRDDKEIQVRILWDCLVERPPKETEQPKMCIGNYVTG